MKIYVIRETTGYPVITRDGQEYQISLGEEFTEAELPSLKCDTYVTYMCTADNSVATITAGAPVAPVKAVAPAPKAPEAPKATPTK